jgi:hypothetical protein
VGIKVGWARSRLVLVLVPLAAALPACGGDDDDGGGGQPAQKTRAAAS